MLEPGESTPPTILLAADINNDNRVDLGDLSVLASQWMQSSKVRIAKFALDADPAWSVQGQWAFGKPLGGGGTLHGNHDPIKGSTGSNVYGVNLNGDYTVSVGPARYMTSGPIDCGDFENIELRFARWLNTDNASYVKCTVEVSNDGTQWHIIWTNPADATITDSQWQTLAYNIGSMADNQSAVYIRWGYQILDPRAYAMSGWNIDEIELWGQ